MRKGTIPMRATAQRLTLVIVAIAVSLLGLVLLAGGGYVLVAGTDLTDPEPAVSAVSADEPTRSVQIVVRSAQDTALPTPSPATDLATATVTPETTGSSEVQTQADTPTATRVVRATSTPTPTAIPSRTDLPDTGFGEFLQPLAGFGLAGIALTIHAIRKRR